MKYYNRFDSKKNWKALKFYDSRYIQSAELNEMQDVIREDFKLLSGSVFNEGAILRGGSITVHEDRVEITESIIFSNGYTLEIPATIFTISLTDDVIIGSVMKMSTVTADDDITLRNPAEGTAGYKEVGAERLVVFGEWKLESEVEDGVMFYPTFRLIDGVLQNKKHIAPELEGARKIVARYDYDSSGSYVVDGMVAGFDRDDEEEREHIISISEGNAHVEGEEIVFDYNQKSRVGFATDTQEVRSEPLQFKFDGTYTPRHTPIANILEITGNAEVIETITHGHNGIANERIENTPLTNIVEIRQGTTIYKNGIDFIRSGDTIDWSLKGNEPNPGSTYTIKYWYQKTLRNIEFSDDSFIVNGLVEGTQFSVDYDYYLKRKDRLLLTKSGDFKVLKGVSDEFEPVPPQNYIGLSLAVIEVIHNQEPQIEIDFYRAFKMSDIQGLFGRIGDMEYNIAKLSLDYNARSIEPTLDKKEIFVDPFIDEDLRDDGIEQNAIIADGILRPHINFDMHSFSSENNLTNESAIGDKVIDQPARTGSRQVNEYMYSEAPPASVSISPSTYSWIYSTRTIWTWWWWRWRSITSSTSIISREVPVPRIQIAVKAKTFVTGEQVDIFMDGILAGTLVAKEESGSRGYIDGSIYVPVGLKSGSKLVELVGKTSNIKTQTIFTATASRRTVVRRRWWRDPLAQTIRVKQDTFISALDFYVENLPSNYLEFSIVKTTVGIPDQSKVVYGERFDRDKFSEGQNQIEFSESVLLESGIEYALIIESDDSVGKVGVAKLGEFDLNTKKWLTTQKYEGVLLSSANSSTWTPIQDEDLNFSIRESKFELNTKHFIGNTEVESATDLYLLAEVENYLDTRVTFKAILKDRGDEVVILSPYTNVSIESYTGEIRLEAEMRTEDSRYSAKISKDITLGVGKVDESSIYVSRQFSVSGDRLDIYLDSQEMKVGNLKVFYEKSEGVYVEVNRDSKKIRHIGDEWIENCFTVEKLTNKDVRIKIELTSSDTSRAKVKNLRGIVS